MPIETNGTKKEVDVDTRSPVIVLPPDNGTIKNKKLLQITRKNQDVNKNENNIAGKITVGTESRGN